MNNPITNKIINEVAGSIDIPDSAYEKAKHRYEDLGDWFGRSEAACCHFATHIYPQGSFRLGTVIRPFDPEGDYDLDVGCRLRSNITKQSHTQKQLKHLVGNDLDEYRIARGIKEEKEEMHRCWRLKYADSLNFHMDVVPSIPETKAQIQRIQEEMIRVGSAEALAQEVAAFTGSITDSRMASYDLINDDWRLSNSEGYARWFESRMNLARVLLENRMLEAKAAKVDDLPTYKWKSPLQRCVQILKSHRDVMYADCPDSKPISIIITTLAAHAYQGETEIGEALSGMLATMEGFINRSTPRIPNPVNPAEDFADKWGDTKYRHLELENNFIIWLEQAKADFNTIGNARDIDLIVENASARFGATLVKEGLAAKLGLGVTHVAGEPKSHTITETPAKPWLHK